MIECWSRAERSKADFVAPGPSSIVSLLLRKEAWAARTSPFEASKLTKGLLMYPHRRQFDKLRILLVGDSANPEKSVQRGLPWNGINQIQGGCGRRIRYRVRRNQVLPGAVNK